MSDVNLGVGDGVTPVEFIREFTTISTYTINGGRVSLREELILVGSDQMAVIQFGRFPYARKRVIGRGENQRTYYEMRDPNNKTIFITDQEGYDTLNGGGNYDTLNGGGDKAVLQA
jgi:hypothetical protein